MSSNRPVGEHDVVLVGAGITSATLGVFLKELEPALNVEMLETLEGAALESSDLWGIVDRGRGAVPAPARRDRKRDAPRQHLKYRG